MLAKVAIKTRHRLIREPAGISRNQNAKRVRSLPSFLHDARVHLVTTGSPRETGFPRAGEGEGEEERGGAITARIYDISPRLNCTRPRCDRFFLSSGESAALVSALRPQPRGDEKHLPSARTEANFSL